MYKLLKSEKFSYYLDLFFVSLVAFVYPAFSFRSGFPHIISIAAYGVFILYLIIRVVAHRKIIITAPSILLIFFILSSIISTAINKNSYLSSSLMLCTILTIVSSLFFCKNKKWLECFSLGYAFGTLFFIVFLLFVSRFHISNLNTNYFVNVNRICNSVSISLIFLVVYIFNSKINILKLITSIAFIALFGFFLVILGSRSAFISFIVVSLINFFCKFWAKHKKLIIVTTIVLIVSIVIIILVVPSIRNTFSRYIDFVSFLTGDSKADSSARERFNMQITALYHFLESPLFGHGIDGYMNDGPFGVYSHNTFTDVLCNFGFIGFILYEVPLLYCFYSFVKSPNKKNKAILISIICYFLITQMTAVLYSDKLNALVYGVLIGQAMATRTECSECFTSTSETIVPVQESKNSVSNPEEDTARKANKSFKWSTVTEIIAKIVVPICNMILSRLIAPEIFGIVASIGIITGLADVFADSGFTYLILHKKINNKSERKKFEGTITLINIVVSSILTVVIIIFRNPLSSFVGADGYGMYMLIAAIQIPFYSFSTIQLSICKRDFVYNKILAVKLITLAAQIGGTVFLALIGRGIEALILRGVIGAITQAVLTPLICKAKPTFCFSKEHFKAIWGLALFYLIDALIVWGTSSIDTIMINQYFNQTIVGIFKNAITMENSIMTLVTAIYYPILIALLGQSKGDHSSLKQTMFSYQKVLSLILIPVGVGMFLYKDFISLVLFGDGWDGASWVIGILGLANIIKTATGGFALIVFYATGRPIYATISNASGILVKIIVYLVFGSFGFVPLLVALTLPFATVALVSILICRQKYGMPIHIYFQNLVLPFLCCTPMIIVGIIQQLTLSGNFGNIVGITLCIIVYFAFALKFGKNNVLNFGNIILGKNIKQE